MRFAELCVSAVMDCPRISAILLRISNSEGLEITGRTTARDLREQYWEGLPNMTCWDNDIPGYNLHPAYAVTTRNLLTDIFCKRYGPVPQDLFEDIMWAAIIIDNAISERLQWQKMCEYKKKRQRNTMY